MTTTIWDREIPLLRGAWVELGLHRLERWGVSFGFRIADPTVDEDGERYFGGWWFTVGRFGFGFHVNGDPGG